MYDNLDTDAARERAADMRRAARERGAEFSQAIAAGANTVAEFCRDTHYNARNMHPFSEADFPVSQHFKHNNGSEYWNLYLASRLGVALHTPFYVLYYIALGRSAARSAASYHLDIYR